MGIISLSKSLLKKITDIVVSKYLKKRFGASLEIIENDFKIINKDGKINIRLNVEAEINEDDALNIIFK